MTSRFRAWPALAVALLGVMGAVTIYLCTPWGLAVSFDSVAYLHIAENVLAGRGFVLLSTEGYRPMTHWPPPYPAVIAAVSSSGLGLLRAARLLQAGLFGANVILAAAMARRATGRWAAAFAAAAVLACSADMLTIHTAAWSEPLFLLPAVGGMWVLAESVQRGQGRPGASPTAFAAGLLVVAGVLIGLACLTRYSGVSVVIAAVIFLLLVHRRRAAILILIVGIAPLTLWLARNHHVAGAGTDRHLAWHPVGPGHLRFAASTMLFWLAPRGMPIFARVVMLVMIGAGVGTLAKARRTGRTPDHPPIQRVLAIFILTYVGFVLLARTFLDAAIPMDARIFSPVLYAGTIAVAIVVSRWLGRPAKTWPAAIAVTTLAALLLPHAIQSSRFLLQLRREGAGYSSRAWQTSPLVAYVRDLPPGTRVYSNGVVPIAFLTGRWTRGIPESTDRLTARADPAYVANIAAMKEELRRGALLVQFESLRVGEGGMDLSELARRLELRPIHETADGTVYAARESPSAVP
jgi:hypothetical protein